jgi:hypothetical protein
LSRVKHLLFYIKLEINNILNVINTKSKSNIFYFADHFIYVEIPNLKLSIDSLTEIEGVYNYSLTFDNVYFKNIYYLKENRDHYKNNEFDLTKYIKIESYDKKKQKFKIKNNKIATFNGNNVNNLYLNLKDTNNPIHKFYYFGKYMNEIYFYRDIHFDNDNFAVTFMNITEQVQKLLEIISKYSGIKYNAYPVGNKILLYPDTPTPAPPPTPPSTPTPPPAPPSTPPTSEVGSEMRN